MEIIVAAVGRMKASPFRALWDDYAKRIGWELTLREVEEKRPLAGAELKARYPLSGGSIEVRELPGRPGVMSCVMHLQPHFQFDQMVTGFKLRTEMQAHGF